MHRQVMEFLGRMKARRPEAFVSTGLTQGRVLECGAYIVNGSPRGLFEAREYVGLDWRAGPGVDTLGLTHAYADCVGFDTVVSTEMLEHDPHWQASLANMARLTRPGGSLIVTCAGPARGPHEMNCAPEGGGNAAGTYYRGLSAVEVVRELRRAAVWEHVHAEQHDAPSDTYVACIGKLDDYELPRTYAGVVSVIIPAVGQPILTAQAVEMAREQAGCPVEIVLVDNGSKPENAEFLAGLGADVYLRYDRMLGYPAACNRGVAVAAGEYICLLNNDAAPETAGWALRLVLTLDEQPADIVSPVTDFVANPAQDVRYAGRKVAEADVLFFVCVLLRRELFAHLGGLDEAFGLGNSEDQDFCIRVRARGGRLVVEPRVFVRHAGHATFGRLPKGMFEGLLASNRELLRRKHRTPDPSPARRGETSP